MNAKIELILANLPSVPWVYLMKNTQGKILYVGKSKSLKNRVSSYFLREADLNFAKKLMVTQIDDIEFLETRTEEDALFLEANLIKKHLPKYNVLLKDDKNYAYILITDDIVPEVLKVRQKGRKGTYFGPYISTSQIHLLLDFIKKHFAIRSCRVSFEQNGNDIIIRKTNGRKIPCLDYYIHLCNAPCLLEWQRIFDYQKNIEKVKDFLSGNTKEMITTLQEEMKNAAQKLEFEKAGKIKNQIEAIHTIGGKYLVRTGSNESFDVLVYTHKYQQHFFGRTQIVGGEITEVTHFIAQNQLEEEENELLEQVCGQIYARENQKIVHIVSDISLNNTLQEALKIRFELPQIGLKQEMLQFAKNNLLHFSYKTQMEAINKFTLSKDTHKNILATLGYPSEAKNYIFECFDISHLSGRYTVASKSVFKNGRSEKDLYRKYKISTLESGQIDDFKSMYEVISRRMREGYEQDNFPTMFVIDGGKGQLSSVVSAMNDIQIEIDPLKTRPIPFVCSLAKEEEEIFIPNKKESIRFLIWSSELSLLVQLRDEAHRFAVGFNRSSREKAMKKNILEEIPSIGPKTRKALLKAAGSVENIVNLEQEILANLLNVKQIEALKDHGIIK